MVMDDFLMLAPDLLKARGQTAGLWEFKLRACQSVGKTRGLSGEGRAFHIWCWCLNVFVYEEKD